MWNKIAPEWAGTEERSNKRRRCQNSMDKRDFVTFAMMRRNALGRTQTETGRNVKTNQERKEPRKLGPPDSSIYTRTEGTTVQLCGNSNVAEKRINDHGAVGQQFQAKNGRIQDAPQSWWKKKNACLVAQMDVFVTHICKEHNQEEITWQIWGPMGRGKSPLTE